MARIPNEEIERLKTEVSVERLVEARGVELRASTARTCWALSRSTTTESRRSWSRRRRTSGTASARARRAGRVIDWVMRAEGVCFRHAVELLREGLPSLAASPTSGDGRRSSSTVHEAPDAGRDADADDAALLRQVVGYYHETLQGEPGGARVPRERGASEHAELIERFRLGFANRTLGLSAAAEEPRGGRGDPRAAAEARRPARERARALQRLARDPGLRRERARSPRSTGARSRRACAPGTPLHLYLPGPHRGVFNAEALAAQQRGDPVRGADRRADLLVRGLPERDGGYGVEGFTDEHLRALRGARHRARADRLRPRRGRRPRGGEAGERADRREGIECYRVLFPQGHGRERVRAEGDAGGEERSGLVLRQARVAGQGSGSRRRRRRRAGRATTHAIGSRRRPSRAPTAMRRQRRRGEAEPR